MSERDVLVAEALSSIPVPEHTPTFWADLHRRLDAEITVHPDEPIGATVTSIAAAKAPAHATGNARLDTGQLPSIRSLTHERTRRRGRAPWLAIAAGLLVLVGAVGVVTLAGDRAGDDDTGGQAADAPTDTPVAPTDGTGGGTTDTTVTAATPTSAPATPTTPVVVVDAATPEGAVQSWLGHLATGDTGAAAAQLGPRSISYIQAMGADPAGLMVESQEGYGAWPDATDEQITATSLGVVPQLGAELAVVTISGTYPGEGGGYRVDVVPVVLDGTTWRIEHLARTPGQDDGVTLMVPEEQDDGTVGPLRPSQNVEVFVPSPGTVFFLLDGGAPAGKPTNGVGRNDDPYAQFNPEQDLGPGRHHLVVVAVGDDGTITTSGETFEVAG